MFVKEAFAQAGEAAPGGGGDVAQEVDLAHRRAFERHVGGGILEQEPHAERFEPDPQQVQGLVPFAQTLSGHLWCWYPDIDPRLPSPVVFCPEEDEVAVLYAPDFVSWLYRMMLEEFSGTFLVERVGYPLAEAQLRHYAAILQPLLPEAWGERLLRLSAGSLQPRQENFYGVISEDECERIVHEDIDYDRLDEEFAHIQEEAE